MSAPIEVVKEGWLLKRGEFIANWRNRYFLLTSDGYLRGFRTKPASVQENPINLFHIEGCNFTLEDEEKSARSGKFGFTLRFVQLTRLIERSFHTETPEERQQWIDAIMALKKQLESGGSRPTSSVEDTAGRNRSMSFLGPRPVPYEISLDDFKMLKVLGKGTFGKVLLARYQRTGEVYAVKVLKKSMILEKEELAHTLTENTVLAKCNHPFLTRLAYSFQTPQVLCFAMEYVNGGELFYHLRKDKIFSEERTLLYIAEICSALTYLHENNIIYRDLKLENLLLDREGHIKITDFGLCKEEVSCTDKTSTFCGTPEYLAPEVITDTEYGPAVDWWGMGIVMYEMLTGKLPFRSRDYDVLFNMIVNDPVPFPPTLPPKAADLLKGLLNKEPNDRLGGGPNDGADVKVHPWFASIDWVKLDNREIKPPYVPKVASETDTSNFDPYFTREDAIITPEKDHPILAGDAQKEFEQFDKIVPNKST